MRHFETGATRDTDSNKIDPEGFLSPRVLDTYFAYMHRHRFQADGKVRDADNWQKGIPRNVYMKSLWRHFFAVWCWHRGKDTPESQVENLCAVMFNAMGYMHELLNDR